MTTPQKIILTAYIILSCFGFIEMSGEFKQGDNPLTLLAMLAFVFVILAIPTFILYKIWGKKK